MAAFEHEFMCTHAILIADRSVMKKTLGAHVNVTRTKKYAVIIHSRNGEATVASKLLRPLLRSYCQGILQYSNIVGFFAVCIYVSVQIVRVSLTTSACFSVSNA